MGNLFLILIPAISSLFLPGAMEVSAGQVTLTTQTSKQLYLAPEPVEAICNLANTGDAPLQNANLNLQVKTTTETIEQQKEWSTQSDFQQGIRNGVDTFKTPDRVTLMPLNDNFNDNFLNPDRWSASNYIAKAPEEQNGLLRTYLPYNPQANWIYSQVSSKATVTGDFDVYVDYKISDPYYSDNNHPANLTAVVGAWWVSIDVWGNSPTYGTIDARNYYNNRYGASKEGRLRISRVGSTYSTYFWNGTDWTLLLTYVNRPTGPVSFQLRTFGQLGSQEVFFDNFTVVGRNYPSSGILRLKYDSGVESSTWEKLSYDAELPVNTAIKLRTRTADTEVGLASASWSAEVTGNESMITSPPGRWIEIETNLETTDGAVTPVLKNIRVTHNNGVGNILWELNTPVNLGQGVSLDLKSVINSENIFGKFLLQGMLTDSEGQEVARASYPFYVFSGNEGLKLAMADSPDPLSVFHELTYTLLVANNSQVAATAVSLTDTLPSSAEFVSATATQGSCSENSGTITCNLGDLASNAVAFVTIKAVPTFISSISNTASVTSATPDPDPSDNTATATTIVNPLDGNYDVSDSPISLAVSQISPNYYGNTKDATLTLSGVGFDTNTHIALVAKNGDEYYPDSTAVDSLVQITVVFDLSQVPVGRYDVKVSKPNDSLVAENAFEVIETKKANLETHLILPSLFGRHAVSTIYVEYKNTGNVAMPAPMLVLMSADPDGSDKPMLTLDPTKVIQNLWTSTMPAGASHTAKFLADGDDENSSGMLEPGESGRMPIYYTGLQQPWDFSDTNVEFKVKIVTTEEATPYDWDTAKVVYKPDGIPQEAWDIIFNNLANGVGPTWGDYVKMLGDNSVYLYRHAKEHVRDINKLFQFELLQAMGHSPLPYLAASTDVAVPAPDLPLVFGRYFSASIAGRHTPGPLGKGWSHPWQISASEDADGDVTISRMNSRAIYQPNSRGGYFSLPGDHSTLTKENGLFVLTSANGVAQHFTSDGKLDYIQDLNGNRITATYTTNGLLSRLAHSSGQFLNFTYNGAGLITAVSGSSGGQSVSFAYDVNNQLAVARDYGGRTTSYTYYLDGPVAHALATQYNPDGTRQDFSYDGNGRLAQVSYNGNPPVYFDYDVGDVTVSNEADHSVQDMFYDADGRFVKYQDQLLQTTMSQFDNLGNLLKVIQPDGTASSMSYDSKGNVTKVVDPLQQTVSMTYGPYKRMTAITDPESKTSAYNYDSQGNLASIVYPDSTSRSYSHDSLGNITTSVNRRGTPINYTYNANGRVLRKDYSNGTSTRYSYDVFGDLVSVTDPTGTTSMEYDAIRQLTRITYPNGRYLEYTYDSAGRRTSVTDQLGYRIDYAYNDDGLLESVTKDGAGEIAHYTYDNMQRLVKKALGNGVYTINEYDIASRLVRLTNYSADNQVLSQFTYEFNSLNRRTKMTTVDGVWTYGYDKSGQLISARFTSSSADLADKEITYVYDNAGNRISETVNSTTTNYAVNNMNQYILQPGSMTFAYDADGNLISKSDGTSTWQYFYDAENRLVSSTGPDGTTEYQYDGLGNLTAVNKNGSIKHYLIDPAGLGNLVGEYDDTGNLVTRYDYGLGLLSKDNDYYTFDGNGNTSEMTDPTDQIVNAYGYEPFGKALYSSETVPNSFKFVGRLGVRQVDNDLLYMRNRFYSPSLGRFMSEDPLGLAGGDVTLYRYVGNNPIMFVDPTGLYWFRQDWQTPGFVGRRDTIVPPGGSVSEFIEQKVPAGYTFGEMHDSFVDAATSTGLPDWLVNIPSMITVYEAAVTTEVLRSVGILDQPVPPVQQIAVPLSQPSSCK